MTSESAACGCGGPRYARGLCRRCYQTHRNRQRSYGRWDPFTPVAPDAARAHIGQMSAAGIAPSQLAGLAGVDPSTVTRIATPGDIRITAEVESALLSVRVPERAADIATDTALVPIHGAQRRIQALIASGYPRRELAEQLGMQSNDGAMEALIGRRRCAGEPVGQTVTAQRDRAVKALFDRLQMIPGTSQRARNIGKRNGWALPFEWDEEALDDPHGKPVRARWSHASTTAERREQTTELTERGLTAAQIAERLHTTTRTVVRDRVQAQRAAESAGALPDSQIEAMGAFAVQARRDIRARRATGQRRERTR